MAGRAASPLGGIQQLRSSRQKTNALKSISLLDEAPTASANIVRSNQMDTLNELRERTPDMIRALQTLVECESPSNEKTAIAECAAIVAGLGTELLGAEPRHDELGGHPALEWTLGTEPKVLVLAHIDTVWPLGTTQRWPFTLEDGRASGPGIFDMKAGLVQGLFALGGAAAVRLLVTSDEETGSSASRELICERAKQSEAVLVLEPSANGALKTARKGVSMYHISIEGRAAHAGLEPEKGVNSTVEIAHQILNIQGFNDASQLTTVTPTLLSAGTVSNTIPPSAKLAVDVRTATAGEQNRVHDAITGLLPFLEQAKLKVDGGPNRPPLTQESSAGLFEIAQQVATELGLESLSGVQVGGGSDGNFTAGCGVPTLDGLGAVGDKAHAEGEFIYIDAMAERAALLAGLVERLSR